MLTRFFAAAALSLTLAVAAQAAPAAYAAAVADPGRPAADVARDADRKPAEVLDFARVKPGQVVVELLPGNGYFTRLLSKAVGPSGKVYAVIPTIQAQGPKPPAVNAIAADPAYANVTVVVSDFTTIATPVKADLVWTSQNYHDLHLARLHIDMAVADRAIFEALKAGGLFLVEDHAAAPGSGIDSADKLHRIDPAIARREVEAAGFHYVGESKALRNPADDHQKPVFDPSIRGRTDQFVYLFRKPPAP